MMNKQTLNSALAACRRYPARAVFVGALLALLGTKLVFGVGPITAVKHAPWYAFDDLDSVPVYIQTLPMMTGETPWDLNTPVNDGSIERVESWGVSSADVRNIMQNHNILTDWWRDEVLALLLDVDRLSDPLLKSYPEAMGLVTHEVVQLIPQDLFMDKVIDSGMPGMVHASGCAPSREFDSNAAGVFYNAAPRRACDNVVGGLVWLLLGSLIVAVFGAIRARSRRP